MTFPKVRRYAFKRYGSMLNAYAGFDTPLIRATEVKALAEVGRKGKILEQTEKLSRQLFLEG